MRDLVPDLLKEAGKKPKVRVLHDNKEYLQALNLKLREEVNEYLEAKSFEELADVYEVVEAIVELLEDIAPGEFRSARSSKRSTKGGFTARQYLLSY